MRRFTDKYINIEWQASCLFLDETCIPTNDIIYDISKFKGPTTIKGGFYDSCISIKKSYEKMTDSNLPISNRLLQPFLGFTEAASKSLMGIHNTVNKEKAKLNKNRYN